MWRVVVLLISVTYVEACPMWLHPSGDGKCLCGATLGTVVVCNNKTQQVGVLPLYCLTSNGDESNTSVVGRCLEVMNHGETLLSPVGHYYKVLGNLSGQEEQTCGYLNRQGDCVTSVNPTIMYQPIILI